MSQTLSRLRELFDDPLLVREGRAMAPTPRAEAMALPLRAALRGLQAAIAEETGFDPARARRAFTLAVHDTNAALLLPRLLPRLQAEAPGVELRITAFSPEEAQEQLRSGAVDLVVSVARDLPSDLLAIPLVEDEVVGLARRGHPLFEGPLTPARYAAYPHGLLSITGRGGGRVDEQLAALGLSRRIALRLPYFMLAPQAVMDSELLVAVPRSLAAWFAESYPVRAFSLPLQPLRFTLSAVGSRRLEADPAWRWFLGQVQRAAVGPRAKA
ncbi:MAG: LysR family transcriptional regulator [Alphaproteobacteria bacterium]|nr:LysR family transcriptional regulator [Alphaproteobacteria bacterium]MCB9793027.1 LysR family transcriptional regulator [Alphaproteobacteria bacterium]